MKCVVAGCDTDQNVVSYTSVFFVNFPTDPDVQQQWFTLLGITELDLVRAMLAGEAKICSCHFTEDSFGFHPVHGYRYLLPTALPNIVPLSHEALEDVNASEGNDSSQGYYVVYMNGESPESAIIDETTLEGEDHELGLIDDLTMKLDEPADEEAVEEIGIEYANGKYYFLKLSGNDPTPESDLQPSCAEAVGDDGLSAAERWNQLVEDTKAQYGDNSTLDILSESVNVAPEADEAHALQTSLAGNKESFDDSKQEEALLKDKEAESFDRLEFLDEDTLKEYVESLEDSSMAVGPGSIVNESSLVDEQEDEQSLTHSGTEPDKELVADGEDEPNNVSYGPIEALDEVSVCGDQVRVRDKNERIDRFFCDDCGKGFQYRSGLERHSLVHSKLKRFFCDECGSGFSQKVNLDIHMRVHTGEQAEKKYECQICLKRCYRMSELESHMMAHLKRFPHVCPICTERYSDLTNFYDHFLAEHRKEMGLQELVDMLSKGENAMVIAGGTVPNNIRREDGRYECTVCCKSYRTEMMLERHKRKMHVKIFRCPHCSRKYPYKSLLAKHLPSHTLEKAFQCAHCTRSYTQRINLKVHMERKHPEHVPELQMLRSTNDETAEDGDTDGKQKAFSLTRLYDCEHCGKSFPRKASLMAHLVEHGKEPNPVTYDCDLCGISLSARMTLMRHRWRVHGARKNNMNMIANLDLKNVTMVTSDDNQCVETDETETNVAIEEPLLFSFYPFEDESNIISEDYGFED